MGRCDFSIQSAGGLALTSFRIVQISDTHLSRLHPQFVGNYEVASDFANADKPDLVIHSGDLAVEATARPDDLVFAKEAMESLAAPYRVIAGNHDIGDNPGDGGYMPKKPVTAERIATYEALFGSSQWQFEAAGWSIIGVNAQLFLSGLAEEAAQEQWLGETLAATNGKPVAIFCHKPLLLDADRGARGHSLSLRADGAAPQAGRADGQGQCAAFRLRACASVARPCGRWHPPCLGAGDRLHPARRCAAPGRHQAQWAS